MDPATIIGLVVAFGAIVGSMVMEGGNPAVLFAPPALVLIFVGTMGACMAGSNLPSTIAAIKWLIFAFTAKKTDPETVVEPLVKMAEKARKEGLLALESEMETIEDPFMRKGLQMAVDGTDPDDLFEILAAEVKAKKASGAIGSGFWTDAGGYSPTIGIIGTVMGLIHVLENLSQPDKLGELIAAAFIATLWGVLSANVMFLPWGKRIKFMVGQETAKMELIIDGVLSIQAGANPRVVATKLKSKMTPAGPGEVKEAA
ncbi:flagellar motor protein [Spongisporangium articulatum]|uniref:Flagellar motor protein n=1 Tax=Spongisporangium articulatum TaxID=3362603 RepID=A0ABW8AIS7_9ACTN